MDRLHRDAAHHEVRRERVPKDVPGDVAQPCALARAPRRMAHSRSVSMCPPTSQNTSGPRRCRWDLQRGERHLLALAITLLDHHALRIDKQPVTGDATFRDFLRSPGSQSIESAR
jgi:hypothetical protein